MKKHELEFVSNEERGAIGKHIIAQLKDKFVNVIDKTAPGKSPSTALAKHYKKLRKNLGTKQEFIMMLDLDSYSSDFYPEVKDMTITAVIKAFSNKARVLDIWNILLVFNLDKPGKEFGINIFQEEYLDTFCSATPKNSWLNKLTEGSPDMFNEPDGQFSVHERNRGRWYSRYGTSNLDYELKNRENVVWLNRDLENLKEDVDKYCQTVKENRKFYNDSTDWVSEIKDLEENYYIDVTLDDFNALFESSGEPLVNGTSSYAMFTRAKNNNTPIIIVGVVSVRERTYPDKLTGKCEKNFSLGETFFFYDHMPNFKVDGKVRDSSFIFPRIRGNKFRGVDLPHISRAIIDEKIEQNMSSFENKDLAEIVVNIAKGGSYTELSNEYVLTEYDIDRMEEYPALNYIMKKEFGSLGREASVSISGTFVYSYAGTLAVDTRAYDQINFISSQNEETINSINDLIISGVITNANSINNLLLTTKDLSQFMDDEEANESVVDAMKIILEYSNDISLKDMSRAVFKLKRYGIDIDTLRGYFNDNQRSSNFNISLNRRVNIYKDGKIQEYEVIYHDEGAGAYQLGEYDRDNYTTGPISLIIRESDFVKLVMRDIRTYNYYLRIENSIGENSVIYVLDKNGRLVGIYDYNVQYFYPNDTLVIKRGIYSYDIADSKDIIKESFNDLLEKVTKLINPSSEDVEVKLDSTLFETW